MFLCDDVSAFTPQRLDKKTKAEHRNYWLFFVFLSKRKKKGEKNNLLQLRCVDEEKSL